MGAQGGGSPAPPDTPVSIIGTTSVLPVNLRTKYFLTGKAPSFDLVISDMGMPGMTGLELSAELKIINSEIPVIICTGFSEQVTLENFLQMGLAGFVAKPFNAENLAREVRRVLAGGGK